MDSKETIDTIGAVNPMMRREAAQRSVWMGDQGGPQAAQEEDMETAEKVRELAQGVLDGGDFVSQVCLADRLLDLVGELEAATHEEEDKITRREAGRTLGKNALTSREWQTLDWFFYGVLARRGVMQLDTKDFLRVAKALGKEVIEEMQLVIDSRNDAAEMDIQERDAAAEQDPKKAFWMYVDGPTFATKAPDFVNRVMPAVADVTLADEARASFKNSCGHDVPDGVKTYADALADIVGSEVA